MQAAMVVVVAAVDEDEDEADVEAEVHDLVVAVVGRDRW